FTSRHFTTVAMPYDFDPEAECPLWAETIEGILPRYRPRGRSGRHRPVRDHRIEVLQEFMGYSLLADTTKFEKFLVLVGSGANGKSTIMSTWVELLGRENVSHVPLDGLSSEF